MDEPAGDLFFPLVAALEEHLSKDPRDAGLLELRAELELSRQTPDFASQEADYTAAIEILSEQPADAASTRLPRLFRRRGDAYLSLEKWPEAVDDYSQVITPKTSDCVLLANRARAHEGLKQWEAAAADWSRAAAGNPEGAKWIAEFARRLLACGQVELAHREFAKSQALYEQLLNAAPDGASVAAELAQLLLEEHEKEDPTRWEVLKPSVAMTVADPWAKLAAAYHLNGDRERLDTLLKRHPTAVVGIGDLYAGVEDWERALAEYRKAITNQPADSAALTKLTAAYESAGRTREAIAYLVEAAAADPGNLSLGQKAVALQAWFGQDKELAATRKRVLSFARDTNNLVMAASAAKLLSFTPSTDKADLEAALALGRRGMLIAHWHVASLAHGMAEYRCGNYAAADEALLAATEVGKYLTPTGIVEFYRAMCRFRQGKIEEARSLAIAATAKMKPLPKDENNPLVGGADHDDLILWLAFKEANAMIKLEAAPPPKEK